MSVAHRDSFIPKTAIFIANPWQVEAEEDGSADPIFNRLFPTQDDQPGPSEDERQEYFQYPVMINNGTKHVFELSDLKTHADGKGGRWTNPMTNKEFKLKDLNPVRFPGFKRYNETIEELRNLSLFEPDVSNRWVRLPVEDKWLDPDVGEGMRMPYAVRPQSSSTEPQLSSRQRPTPATLIEQGLPIMQRILEKYSKYQPNSIMYLSSIIVLFHDQAIAENNQAMINQSSDRFVCQLLEIFAYKYQKYNRPNVDIIPLNREVRMGGPHLAYFINAKMPLVRLAHLFVHDFIDGKLGTFAQIVDAKEVILKMFRDFVHDKGVSKMDHYLNETLVYKALSNVPGVSFDTDPRKGKRYCFINAAQVPALTDESGFNQGKTLKDSLRSLNVEGARPVSAPSSSLLGRRNRAREEEEDQGAGATDPALTVLRDALTSFVQEFRDGNEIMRDIDEVRRLFFEYSRQRDPHARYLNLPIRFIDAAITSDFPGIVPLSHGQFIIGLNAHGNARGERSSFIFRSFRRDYGELLNQYVNSDDTVRTPINFASLFSGFSTFCARRGRFINPLLYNPEDTLQVLTTAPGIRRVSNDGDEDEMWVIERPGAARGSI